MDALSPLCMVPFCDHKKPLCPYRRSYSKLGIHSLGEGDTSYIERPDADGGRTFKYVLSVLPTTGRTVEAVAKAVDGAVRSLKRPTP
jgi:hypothetical protein